MAKQLSLLPVCLGLLLLASSLIAQTTAMPEWLVRVQGLATPSVYNGSSFVPGGPAVPVTATAICRRTPREPSSPSASFQVTKVTLNINNGQRTYACDESDPNAINWYGTPEGACDYGTNTLQFWRTAPVSAAAFTV